MVQQLDVQIDAYNQVNKLKRQIQRAQEDLVSARSYGDDTTSLENHINKLNSELQHLINTSYLVDNG